MVTGERGRSLGWKGMVWKMSCKRETRLRVEGDFERIGHLLECAVRLFSFRRVAR